MSCHRKDFRLLNTYSVPDSLSGTFQRSFYLVLIQEPLSLVHTLRMRKMKHREIKELIQGHPFIK